MKQRTGNAPLIAAAIGAASLVAVGGVLVYRSLSATRQLTMPGLVGRTEAEARTALSAVGLKLGEVMEGDSTRPPGQIFEQTPAQGSPVTPGSTVSVVVSAGVGKTGPDETKPGESPAPTPQPRFSPTRSSIPGKPVGELGSEYKPAPRSKSNWNMPKQTDTGHTDFLKAADGSRVELVADGLEHPRWFTVAPNGDLFVVESRLEVKKKVQPNRVIVLRDKDGDGRAETKSLWADKLYLPFGIAFFKDHLYVANTGSVVRWPYTTGALKATAPAEVVVPGIPEVGMRQHWTRNICFAPDGKTLFITIGSKENVDVEEDLRATICTVPLDDGGKATGGLSIYASGMRNPVGMTFHPKTNLLWAVVNERDYWGDNLVPDFFTQVKQGGFYGWPEYWLGPNRDERVPDRPERRSKVLVPEVMFDAHSAPLGLVFWRGDAYVALHGSQNRQNPVGYNIVRIPFDANTGKPTGPPVPYVTGWLATVGQKRSNVFGRPAGLAVDNQGNLLIADDWGGKIWRVVPAGAADRKEGKSR